MPAQNSKLLSTYQLDPEQGDIHFDLGDAPRPWRKVALAVGLLLFGSVLLFTGLGLYLTGKPHSGGASRS